MGDSIGTNRAGYGLESVEIALFSQLVVAIEAGDFRTADNWVDLLERLSIV